MRPSRKKSQCASGTCANPGNHRQVAGPALWDAVVSVLSDVRRGAVYRPPRQPASDRRPVPPAIAQRPFNRIQQATSCSRMHSLHSQTATTAPNIQAAADLALPKRPCETYTAHATATPAVQSNEVYLTPCTARAFDCLHLGAR
jgi:hypothetical protein